MLVNNKLPVIEETKNKLQALWIFVLFNYLYCDLISNMESTTLKAYLEGHVGSIQINQEFLLGAAILMEIPMVLILLSRILNYRPNRWANIIAGTIMTLVQVWSLFSGVGTAPTLHYIFYSVIEITCTTYIVWYAWNWRKPEVSQEKSI